LLKGGKQNLGKVLSSVAEINSFLNNPKENILNFISESKKKFDIGLGNFAKENSKTAVDKLLNEDRKAEIENIFKSGF